MTFVKRGKYCKHAVWLETYLQQKSYCFDIEIFEWVDGDLSLFIIVLFKMCSATFAKLCVTTSVHVGRSKVNHRNWFSFRHIWKQSFINFSMISADIFRRFKYLMSFDNFFYISLWNILFVSSYWNELALRIILHRLRASIEFPDTSDPLSQVVLYISWQVFDSTALAIMFLWFSSNYLSKLTLSSLSCIEHINLLLDVVTWLHTRHIHVCYVVLPDTTACDQS